MKTLLGAVAAVVVMEAAVVVVAMRLIRGLKFRSASKEEYEVFFFAPVLPENIDVSSLINPINDFQLWEQEVQA